MTEYKTRGYLYIVLKKQKWWNSGACLLADQFKGLEVVTYLNESVASANGRKKGDKKLN